MGSGNQPDTGEFDPRELRRQLEALRAGSPRPTPVRVTIGALTHPGLVRTNNEDHFIAGRLRRSAEVLATNLPDGYVPRQFEESAYTFAVADGMGGAAAGEVASSLALSLGMNLTLEASRWHTRLDEEAADLMAERVSEFFRVIDGALSERAKSDPGLTGMGTTLTVAYTVGLDALVFHLGDSRAYLFHQGVLRQITRDETLAQAMADAGEIPADSVAQHPMRHVLTRAMGAGTGRADAVVHELRLEPGDRVLLCTDGLTDMLEDAAITDVLARVADPQQACEALIEAALAAGGKDNVTAVIARYETDAQVAVS
jgi:protein phosphatase